MLRSFFKKGGNNTPVHIANFLAEDLSCCRGVIGGGYTGNMFKHARLNMFKTYCRPTQKSEKRERGRERERKKKNANQAIFGPVGVHSRNPIDSLQNAGVPIVKSPPWDLVTSLQSAWPWKFPF